MLLVLTLGIAVGGVSTWFLTDEPAQAPAADHEADLPAGVVEIPAAAQTNAGIQTAAVVATRLAATLEVTGIVTADESRVAHVRPLARGVVEKIAVSFGSRVTAGQPLLTYDNIELGQLVGEFLSVRAALRQAETDRDVKRSALARAEALIKIEAIAQQELDVRRAEFRNAEAAVGSAQAACRESRNNCTDSGCPTRTVAALAPDLERGAASRRLAQYPARAVHRRRSRSSMSRSARWSSPTRNCSRSPTSLRSGCWPTSTSGTSRRSSAMAPLKSRSTPIRIARSPGRITHVSDLIDPASRTAKVRCVVDNRDGALKLDMFAKVTHGDGRSSGRRWPCRRTRFRRSTASAVVFVRLGAHALRTTDRAGRATRRRRRGDPRRSRGRRAGGRPGSFYLKTALLRERIGDEH